MQKPCGGKQLAYTKKGRKAREADLQNRWGTRNEHRARMGAAATLYRASWPLLGLALYPKGKGSKQVTGEEAERQECYDL